MLDMSNCPPSFVRIPALRPGARIAVIAPSGPFDVARLEAGVERLRTRYGVDYGPSITETKGYLAGDDERRLGELLAALEDPSISAIVPVRGGYGATRLLERIPIEQVASARKLLIGFSDITALLVTWARAGLCCLHGPMAARLGQDPPSTFEAWVRSAEGEIPPAFTDLRSLHSGKATGPLLGGNLAVLCALCGTPYGLSAAGSILFLEDVKERPYRIDRMLTTLMQAGFFEGVRGIVLGSFTLCEPDPDGVTVDEVLAERLTRLDVPVVSGMPVGHGSQNATLGMGALVTLDADRGCLTFLESAVSR